MTLERANNMFVSYLQSQSTCVSPPGYWGRLNRLICSTYCSSSGLVSDSCLRNLEWETRWVIGGQVMAAFSGPYSCMVSGQRTCDDSCPAHVDHIWEKASMGSAFVPVAGKGRSQEQQLVKWGMEGAKKRSWPYFLPGFRCPICRGSLGVRCLCVGSYSWIRIRVLVTTGIGHCMVLDQACILQQRKHRTLRELKVVKTVLRLPHIWGCQEQEKD